MRLLHSWIRLQHGRREMVKIPVSLLACRQSCARPLYSLLGITLGKQGAPSFQGDAQVIGRQGNLWAGASDPRRGGLALGY